MSDQLSAVCIVRLANSKFTSSNIHKHTHTHIYYTITIPIAICYCLLLLLRKYVFQNCFGFGSDIYTTTITLIHRKPLFTEKQLFIENQLFIQRLIHLYNNKLISTTTTSAYEPISPIDRSPPRFCFVGTSVRSD